MNKTIPVIIAILMSVIVYSVKTPHHDELKISITKWIGYTPLFYAESKGWLHNSNIELTYVSSLSENMYMFNARTATAYTGTQFEHDSLKPNFPTILPVVLFDKSYGGDVIMSNVSIEELRNTPDNINLFLEQDSVNTTILNAFIKKYNIPKSKLTYHNIDQQLSNTIKFSKTRPIIIVTYTPYNIFLEKIGFKEILSTKTSDDIFVVDGLFTTQSALTHHREQFNDIVRYISLANKALDANPREYYNTIRPYLGDVTFEEFEESLTDIKILNETNSKDIVDRLSREGMDVRELR